MTAEDGVGIALIGAACAALLALLPPRKPPPLGPYAHFVLALAAARTPPQ